MCQFVLATENYVCEFELPMHIARACAQNPSSCVTRLETVTAAKNSIRALQDEGNLVRAWCHYRSFTHGHVTTSGRQHLKSYSLHFGYARINLTIPIPFFNWTLSLLLYCWQCWRLLIAGHAGIHQAIPHDLTWLKGNTCGIHIPRQLQCY